MAYNILVVDDEIPNLLLIEEYLSDSEYCVTTARSAEEGLGYLASDKVFHAILLDRMMPYIDGMQVLEKIKANNARKRVPVIMQTAATAPENIAEGLKEGIFYYLEKPFKKEFLQSLVASAIADYSVFDALNAQLSQHTSALQLMTYCQFSFQTLEDAMDIATYIAQCYPRPEDAVIGVRELMVNAVEHGNLGIGYDEKTELNNKGSWSKEIERRLTLEENQSKYATVRLSKQVTNIELVIEDMGKGFDWGEYLQISPKRALDNHGRGIAMANMMSFDTIEYQAPGNRAICRTHCA